MDATLPSLLTKPQDMKRVIEAVTTAVACSYVSHPVRLRTDAEDARRSRRAIEIVKVMRGDLKWSVLRTCDSLTKALQADLSGLEWATTRRAWWGAGQAG